MKPESPPHVPNWFQNGFHRFLRPFLKRHFHAVAVERASHAELTIDESEPLIVYGNHPSWWDPLMAHFLNRSLFPDRQFYAPIDADALEDYRVFAKLGFYGVRMNSTSGAAAFLKLSTAILNAGDTAIWMTPEGHFADERDHSSELMPGLGHLCTKVSRGAVLPVALEYDFWEERLPVCLVKIGASVSIAEHSELKKAEWSELLTTRLRDTQRGLADLAIARSSDPFENLLHGRAGAGWFYDSLRRIKSVFTGRRFHTQHGEQFE